MNDFILNEDLINKFSKWDENIQNSKITNENNEKVNNKFNEILSSNVNFEKVDNKENFKLLKFGFENKIEIYFSKEKNILIAKVIFDHLNGGRVGLVHGGVLYSILILCTYIFISKSTNNKLQIQNINTTYKKKVPVNNYLIVKVYYSDSGNKIISEMIDYEDKVTTLAVSQFKEYEKINKF